MYHNKKHVNLYWLLLISTLLFQCESNPILIKKIKIDIPYQPKIVLFSVISPRDTVIRVSVHKNEPVSGEIPKSNRIMNAQVSITDGVDTVYMVMPEENSAYYEYTIDTIKFRIKAGITYHLSATSPEGLHATASTKVPLNTVDFKSIDVDIDGGLRIIFDNIPGENDYYVISHFRIDQQFGFIYNDELLQLIHGKDILGNRLITKRVTLKSGIYIIGLTDYNYYQYHKDLIELAISGGPFNEPSPIHTNIEGGLGLFGSYNWVAFSL